MYQLEMEIVVNGFLFVFFMVMYLLFQQDLDKKTTDIVCTCLIAVSILNIFAGYLYNSLLLCFFAIVWLALYVNITIDEQRSSQLVTTLTLLAIYLAICISFVIA